MLKDIIVKSLTLSGRRALLYRAGTAMACRSSDEGKKLGKVGSYSPRPRAACRAFATEQVAHQSTDFQRLGVLGDWENPI
ncbi:MAG: hypothetical protein R3F36_01805 [Candidatus Competibacteraceae bacterium]